MLRHGEYVAWFNTPLGSGTGRVLLKDGRLSGHDTIIRYDGTYVVEGKRFTVTVSTCRWAAGHESLLGNDDVEITLSGTAKPELVTCSGSLGESPETKIQVILLPVRDDPQKPEMTPKPEDYRPERLPKSKRR
jgi:hypothetical protein